MGARLFYLYRLKRAGGRAEKLADLQKNRRAAENRREFA
jgi:hypothetical protein